MKDDKRKLADIKEEPLGHIDNTKEELTDLEVGPVEHVEDKEEEGREEEETTVHALVPETGG